MNLLHGRMKFVPEDSSCLVLVSTDLLGSSHYFFFQPHLKLLALQIDFVPGIHTALALSQYCCCKQLFGTQIPTADFVLVLTHGC